MARGRNQNRGRNQQTQNTQIKNFPLNQQYKHQQQQPQILTKSVSEHQTTNTKATTTTNPSSYNLANAPVANINKQLNNNNNNQKCNIKNITISPSIKSESYGHINKTNNTISRSSNSNKKAESNSKINKNNYDNDEKYIEAKGGGEDDLKTHLETNEGDPAISSTTNTTYQMTMSNNSSDNFSQHETNDDAVSHNNDDQNNDHVRSVYYSNSENESIIALRNHETNALQQRENEQMLNNETNAEHNRQHGTIINSLPVIGQNGSTIVSVTDNNNIPNVSDRSLTATQNFKPISEQLEYELAVDDHDRLIFEDIDKPNIYSSDTMGQKNTKGDHTKTSSSTFIPSAATSSSNVRAFQEPITPSPVLPTHNSYDGNNNNQHRNQSCSIQVPIITVVDCSSGGGQQTAKSYESDKTENDEFYDFEIETSQQQHQHTFTDPSENKEYDNVPDATAAKQIENSTYGKPRTASPTSMYSRYNYMKLEDVEEEDEDEAEDEDGEDDQESEHEEREQRNVFSSRYSNNSNLDSEHAQHKLSNALSPDRLQQQHNKSTNINIYSNNNNNTSDYNLSTSFPDSGMGESMTSSTTNCPYINANDSFCDASSSTMKEQQQQQPNQQAQQHIPFVRDGNSTDCDETLMQCDELLLDFAESTDYLDPASSERLVCIESISLPDVVVESTNSNGNNGGTTSANTNQAATSSLFASKTLSSSSSLVNSCADRGYVNINGATGATINSVQFIPIHIEGSGNNMSTIGSGGGSGRSSPRKQSVDDSLVGSSRATIEIIEDASELQQHSPSSARSTKNLSELIAEKLKNDLVEQKAQFNVQLEDAHKNVNNLQTKLNEMQTKIEKLEQELSAKTWNVERLQGELNAAQKDDEYVRKKLKLVEDEKTNLRHRYSENEDELKRKYDDLELQYNELQDKYKQTQSLASNLHTQLAKAQTEAEEWREEVNKIRSDLEEQIQILQNSLENSENERKICEDRWQREFEMLRTHNMDREESIMTDCEWQLRQMQRQCKDKMDKADNGRKAAEEKVEELEEELEERRKEIDDLKIYQAQVNCLRGVVNEQELSIQNLVSQIEHLKSDLAIANENLSEQIEAVKKIKYHCDNALYDKDRQMMYRIDEVRNEAAAFWEDKLYTEMTRLKNELESVYVDERREALDKLQTEHIEELKALTNRYTDNEEELRMELAETQQLLEQKTQDFMEFREKSDNALLQTRMHLDRADREYQKAMCQEEERREALEQSLRQEFESEKQEMEEKFRERLGQVKEEFAKELQINTHELREEHQKEIEKLKAKLQAEKDEALQALSQKHRKKLSELDEKIKNIEQHHKNDLKDLKAAYHAEKVALDKRDISNANEIEQLHRKCRCLTNLFEEMRMRYERRDPRPEDLREIAELRTRCESQERDLYLLTDRLREMQIQMNELQHNGVECNSMNNKNNKKSKQIKKPPPKTIPTNCDVIYEENEERESPPPTQNSIYANKQQLHDNNEEDDDSTDEGGEHDQIDGKEKNSGEPKEQRNTVGQGKINQSSHEGKNIKLLIKDNVDDSHMITAV